MGGCYFEGWNCGLEENLILKHLPVNCTEIISGGACGIDSLAEAAANRLDITFLCLAPNYKAFGHRAPLVRNCEIVAQSDYLLIFWNMQSNGTRHVLAECIKTGRAFKIIRV